MQPSGKASGTPGFGVFLTIILALVVGFGAIGRLGRMPAEKVDRLLEPAHTSVSAFTRWLDENPSNRERESVIALREKTSQQIGSVPVTHRDPGRVASEPVQRSITIPERRLAGGNAPERYRLPVERDYEAPVLDVEPLAPRNYVEGGGDGFAGGGAPRRHLVKNGESLHAIARQYAPADPYGYIEKIRQANPSLRSSGFRVGMDLTLPDAPAG